MAIDYLPNPDEVWCYFLLSSEALDVSDRLETVLERADLAVRLTDCVWADGWEMTPDQEFWAIRRRVAGSDTLYVVLIPVPLKLLQPILDEPAGSSAHQREVKQLLLAAEMAWVDIQDHSPLTYKWVNSARDYLPITYWVNSMEAKRTPRTTDAGRPHQTKKRGRYQRRH